MIQPITLTRDEAIDAELMAEVMAESASQRRQFAAELILARKVIAAAKSERSKLPIRTRHTLVRWPSHTSTHRFDLSEARDILELTP
jgi:hypothetical protein